MGLFVLVMVEWVGNEHAAITPIFFDTWWHIDDLPHLAFERYREYMEQVDVNDADDLAGVIRLLETYGFAETRTGGTFQFRTASYRFLELCVEAAEMSASSDAEASDTDTQVDLRPDPLPPIQKS